MLAMTATTDRLPFTGDDAADRLLVSDPLALLIGFALDQQVTVQKAFSGPLELQRRIGHLDAAKIAATDPAELDAVFRKPPGAAPLPGLHGRQGPAARRRDRRPTTATTRPASGRKRADGPDLKRRLLALPGIGEMKAAAIIAILGKRLGLDLPGLDAVMPTHPTLGDVDSPEALASYQAGKRAMKAEKRAPRREPNG